MKKPYQLLCALGIAVASLSSCSRANYAVNTTAPLSESMQVAAPVSDAAASGTALVKSSAPKSSLAQVAPTQKAPAAARTASAEVVKEAVQPVAATSDAVETKVAPGPTAKPSLIQRLALKGVAKQLNKIQQKQATARTEQIAASKKGRALLIALAGLLLALIGLIIVGGSGLGGSGAGVVIGAILYYIGFIALIVGLVIFIIHLINGD